MDSSSLSASLNCCFYIWTLVCLETIEYRVIVLDDDGENAL